MDIIHKKKTNKLQMSEIKISLSLELQGGTMLSEQECSGNSKKKKDCYDYFRMKVEDDKGKNKEVIIVPIRKSKTIKQNIKLSKEAYDYMISEDSCPVSKSVKEWRRLTKNQRLQYHCKLIAEHFGAIGFHFEILDD